MESETKQETGVDFSKIFDSQCEKLKGLGCPEQILDILREQRDEVLRKIGGMTVSEGNVPFLPVIPREYLSPYTLMSMVRTADAVGCNYLKPTDIKNVVEVPDIPYYIFDINTGESTLGKSHEEVSNICTEKGRRCLTADEAMNLCIHANVLSSHYVLAGGSRHGSDGIPNVSLVGGDYPGLGWVPVYFSSGQWVSATCIVLDDEGTAASEGGK